MGLIQDLQNLSQTQKIVAAVFALLFAGVAIGAAISGFTVENTRAEAPDGTHLWQADMDVEVNNPAIGGPSFSSIEVTDYKRQGGVNFNPETGAIIGSTVDLEVSTSCDSVQVDSDSKSFQVGIENSKSKIIVLNSLREGEQCQSYLRLIDSNTGERLDTASIALDVPTS